jgi:hypothetical protein
MIPEYQLSLMRSSPQMSDVYLVIQQPEYSVAGMYGAWAGYEWSCQVNGNPTDDPVATITVDNGQAGPVDLLDGMTVFVGSAPGEWDKGIFRLRGDQTVSGATTSISIGVSSDVRGRVLDGDYLVVLDEFRLWQRYGRIVTSGSNITWYKDWSILWTDLGGDDATRRLASMPPVPIMQPHGVKFVETGGSAAQFYFDWSDSYAVAPSESVDSWASYGEQDHAGTQWSSALETPGWQTVNAISGLRGFRTVLEVDDGNGNLSNLRTRRGVRYMFTLRRPGETQPGDPPNSEPLTKFSFTPPQASYQQGYWRTSITVYQDEATDLIIIPGALVILFTEDWYSHELPYLSPTGRVIDAPGPIDDRGNILLVGRIADNSINYDDEYQQVSFDVITPAEEAAQYVNYPISISNDATGSEWIYAPSLTVDRAMRHYNAWHTTLTLVADVYQTGDTRIISAQDFMEGPIFSTLNSFLHDRIRARLGCDKYGRFFAEVNVNEDPYSTVQTLWSLDNDDWLEPLQIRQINRDKNAALDAGGLYYDTAAGTVTPYLSRAPGEYSGYRGGKSAGQNLAIDSQTDLNNLAGRIREAMNNEWPATRMNMSGQWRWLDIYPQRSFTGTISTIRGDLTGRFIIRDVTNAYNADAGAILTSIVVELETDDGVPGVTISIPATLPTPVAIDPPRTPLPPSLPPDQSATQYKGMIMGTNPEGMFYSDDYTLATLPVWTDMNNDQLTAFGSKNVWSLKQVLYPGVDRLFAQCYCGFYSYDLPPRGDGVWVELVRNYEMAVLAGAPADDYFMMDTAYSTANPGHAWAIFRAQDDAGAYAVFRLIVCHTHNGWQSLEWSNVVHTVNRVNGRMGRAAIALANDGTDQVLYMAYGANDGPSGWWVKKSTDGGFSWTAVRSDVYGGTFESYPHSLWCPPSNSQYVYAMSGRSSNDFTWSIDGGASWSTIVAGGSYPWRIGGSPTDETKAWMMTQDDGMQEFDIVAETLTQWGTGWQAYWGVSGATSVRILERDAVTGGLSKVLLAGQEVGNVGGVLLVEAATETDVTENWNAVANDDWINCISLPALIGEFTDE